MRAIQYTIELSHDAPNFWALSDRQLAASCVEVAQGHIAGTPSFLRAEALRLFLQWREAINAPSRTLADAEQARGRLAALRKRTIQILVRLSLRAATSAQPPARTH